MEIITLYSENRRKSINRLCGKNAVFVNVKAVGVYRFYYVLEGLRPKR
jgi:hypothetical protein